MEREDAFDERALIERIRERLREVEDGRTSPLPASPPRPEPAEDHSAGAADAELEAMAVASDVADVPLRSYRRLMGSLVTFARKLASRLLAGPLERQTNYNAANRRLAAIYQHELQSLRRDHEALRTKCEALEAKLRELESGSRAR